MRGARVFVDTNVLLYTRQRVVDEKSTRAIEWLRLLVERQYVCINLQVLNELANVLIRKRDDLADEDVFEAVDQLLPLGSSPIRRPTVFQARNLRRRYRYSWWDCLLLASALELGCSHFLSEDLQDGQDVEGLTIVDPFAHSPDKILSN